MQIWCMIQTALLGQRGHMFPWVPVFLAGGIGVYFSLTWEPGLAHFLYLAVFIMISGAFAFRCATIGTPFWGALALLAMGGALAGARAHLVEAPVLKWRYYGPVEGRVVALDRSGSDAVRLTLDRVVLANMAPAQTPKRVRVALHGDQIVALPNPGDHVMTTAHLSPPGGPVEPGGFDFQRHSWFQGLGAVGYTRVPVLHVTATPQGMPVGRLRMALSGRVQAALPGETGAVAAALISGDRSGVGLSTLAALRASNLAHLLAISGLHMGLVASFVFASLRILLSLSPWVALRLPVKKIAALGALAVAAGYLMLSGGAIATERAFVMVAVALMAVVADRRVFSLRAVAVAAMIVLILRPEALLSPGFQMSFAATTALVASFGWLRDRQVSLGPKWLRPIVAVLISSAVAGAATAPFAAAHFNQIAHFGLLANLLSVPLMGAIVIPAAVVAVCLMPLGLQGAALWVMGLGLKWILFVAGWVAEQDGAVGMVTRPDWFVLPLLAAGGIFLLLWQGRARGVGAVIMLAAVGFWGQSQRPEILIAGDGALIGVLTPKGRALSKPRGAGFAARNWLENDGDPSDQSRAAARWQGLRTPEGGAFVQIRGKKSAQQANCRPEDWLISPNPLPEGLECRYFDLDKLRQTGAVGFLRTSNGYRQITARGLSGTRIWHGAGAPSPSHTRKRKPRIRGAAQR